MNFHSSILADIAGIATLAALPAAAQTISFEISVGDTVTVIPSALPLREGERFTFGTTVERSTTPLDIIFLADNTGSMGSLVTTARREADDIIARTSTLAGNAA